MKCDPNQFRAAPPSLAVKPRLIRQLFLPPLTIALMIGLGYIGFWISEYYGIRTLSDTGERQLELHARTVESELSKYTYLPSLLELESSVSKLLADPNQETRKTVNDYLEGLNRRSRSRAIYVMDTTGRVLATSNWRDADSYQGEDLSFRAYFQNAVRGQPGRFYGIGSTNGEPGYYLAHGLEEHGKIIGVAVVKVRLEALEERWQRAQRHQAKRRVAAGDQQVDRKVIDLLHDLFSPPAHAVVHGRRAVQHHQRKTIDRHADDLPGAAIQARHHQHPHGADTRRDCTEQMAPGVEAFPVIHVSLTSCNR